MNRTRNLLDEALELNNDSNGSRVVVVEDCVETSGAFVIHHLIKRNLSLPSSLIVFVAFSQPFSHYERILRKLGCNLVMQRESGRFHFLDMLSMQCPDGEEEKLCEGGLVSLYGKIQKAIDVSSSTEGNKNSVTIMIDDISLVEVAANGSSNHVLDFLHYCLTLTLDFGCTLVILSHKDVYSSMEKPMLMLQMEYLADVLIKAEPLATGLATDVHGQLTVVNRGRYEKESLKTKTINFQFKIRDNNVECFYPGSQT